MLKAKDALDTTARRTILIQVALTAAAALVAWIQHSEAFALALLYGGAVVMIGTGIHAWRLKIATESVDNQPHLNTAEFMKGAVLKLGTMIVLLVVGMGALRLDPLAVILGLGIAYTGFLFSRSYAPRSRG